MKVLNNDIKGLDKGKVFRLLGRQSASTPTRAATKVREYADNLLRLARPRVIYTTRKVKSAGKGSVVLEDGTALKSAKLARTLGKCKQVTFFLATIGKDVDKVINRLAKDNKMSDAYIYDAIGSVAVEEAVEDFQKKFEKELSDDRKSTTMRFSPGYCDWSIEEQSKIFDVLDGSLAGVELSPEFLMSPRKSISGVFGIAPGPKKAETNPCTTCSRESCIARR